MDGTLIDSEPTHLESVARTMRCEGLAVPGDLAERVIGYSAEFVHDWLQRDCGLQMSIAEWIRLKYQYYVDAVERVPPFGDAVRLWQCLFSAGIKQAVVSNSDRIVVQANLVRCGILRPRLVSISCNDITRTKPHAEPYLRAAALLGVHPGACVVLEDSLTGASSGMAAGMRTFLVPHAGAAPCDTVERLEDLGFIAQLCGIAE